MKKSIYPESSNEGNVKEVRPDAYGNMMWELDIEALNYTRETGVKGKNDQISKSLKRSSKVYIFSHMDSFNA